MDATWQERAMASADAAGGVAPGTRLSDELHGVTGDRVGPIDAFKLARSMFLRGERIDMTEIATQLGVDRATLFRWVGNREQLIGEVIWATGSVTWRDALREAEGRGADRIVDVFLRFVQGVNAADFFHVYLRRERERALRTLTTRDGVHQARIIARFQGLLELEREESGLVLPMPAHDLAYVLTRIAESFIYSDLLIGEEPDAEKAADVVAAIFGVQRAGPRKPTPKEEEAG